MRPRRYHRDRDGRIYARDTKLSRAAIANYYGREIVDFEALGLDPDRQYKLLKRPETLAAAAASFESAPLYLDHCETHRPELVAGAVGNVRLEGDFLTADVALWSQQAIDAAITKRTKPAVSLSYDYAVRMVPGVYRGRPYDGEITDMRGRHVALAPFGRAGLACEFAKQETGS